MSNLQFEIEARAHTSHFVEIKKPQRWRPALPYREEGK
jgi:hypothetical protein